MIVFIILSTLGIIVLAGGLMLNEAKEIDEMEEREYAPS
jgi:hypothetical protein